MLSKEESLKKAKELSYGWHVGDNEFVPLKDVNKLIREIYSIKPYKWEDLDVGIWVWDDVFKEVCFISSIISIERMYVEYLESHCSVEPCKIMPFEENRFYPVQMANVGYE